MPFRPKLPKVPRDPLSYSLIPGPQLPHHRQKDLKIRPLVYLSNGRTLAQSVLPPLPGQVAFAGNRPQDGTPRPRTGADNTPDTSNTPHSRHARKRQNQTTRWLQTIIPLLLPIYVQLVAKTDNLHEIDAVFAQESPRVTLLCWDRLDQISIHICPCSLAAPQLLRRGFFPCTPMEPSLAIELRVLEFVMGLFLNMPPNNTALTKTLEGYLDEMGYKVDNRDTLRRRFGNALEWYTSMRHMTTARIDSIILQARHLPCSTDASDMLGPSALNTVHPTAIVSFEAKTILARRHSTPRLISALISYQVCARVISFAFAFAFIFSLTIRAYPFAPPEDRSRLSDYLRARCPACFSGKWENPTIILAAILSGDACFTHRQNKGNGRKDPVHQHPATVFVPDDVTRTMETYVDSVRPAEKPARQTRKLAVAEPVEDEEEDHFEDPKMPVPKSILDDCQASFAAADEKRIKSSTQFFDNTGLMGINCRHDHLLFLVNMKTAGEKQFNMYALIEMVLRHLPLKFVVGFLYDIACNLERSARKWGFLPPEYMERLHFAVSVLHAFGHHWGCQLKYHPRRRTLFGLSDGEGCECFWHSISKLISYLRVCGYYRRLYTLDSQIHHLQQASIRCLEKRQEAEETLRNCKQPMNVLRSEYKKQVEAQTKLLPKRSKSAGKLAIEEVVRLRKGLVILNERVRSLEDVIVEGDWDVADIEITTRDLQVAKEKRSKYEVVLCRKESALGVDEQRTLRHLVNSPYIQARMNARTLKFCLREKLQTRKFELERVTATYHVKKTDPKLTTHIEDAVKRRNPGIQELVRHYNRLCAQMATLIGQKKAPRNVEIWQDVGLDDVYDEQEPPLWLKTEQVRNGIKGMLKLDRCTEEEPRVFHECRALRYWLVEEWDAVSSAMTATDKQNNAGVVYQLKLRRKELCQLCATWKAAIRPIPFKIKGLPPWGPSDQELLAVRVEDVVSKMGKKSWEEDNNNDDDDEDDYVSSDEEEEELPIEEIEVFQQGQVYPEQSVYYEVSGDPQDPWGTYTDDDNWFAQ
ncbi:hypothetical protein B0H19DRAFT_1251527 [Mycena capillaripes]|nr:hypothetical protein B0H19DRAFT_1251527 [Mycena capillaripes]